MSSTQPGWTDKTPRHLPYVLRIGNPEVGTPVLDSVERWNWAVRISVVGLFVAAMVVIAFRMASVVVPVVLAWVVAMVLESGRVNQLFGLRGKGHQNGAYCRSRSEQHAQEQQAASEKNCCEKTILQLTKTIAQDSNEPKEGNPCEWHQVDR